MIFRRREKPRTISAMQARDFLRGLGVEIYSRAFNSMGIDEPADETYFNSCFEDLTVCPYEKDDRLKLRVSGTYVFQGKLGSRKSGGIWKPTPESRRSFEFEAWIDGGEDDN